MCSGTSCQVVSVVILYELFCYTELAEFFCLFSDMLSFFSFVGVFLDLFLGSLLLGNRKDWFF